MNFGIFVLSLYRNSAPSPFIPFSAFRPVAKIGDFLQLGNNCNSAINLNSADRDSGETCEVSTTVGPGKDSLDESEMNHQHRDKSCSESEVIDVESEEKTISKEVKSEPQV